MSCVPLWQCFTAWQKLSKENPHIFCTSNAQTLQQTCKMVQLSAPLLLSDWLYKLREDLLSFMHALFFTTMKWHWTFSYMANFLDENILLLLHKVYFYWFWVVFVYTRNSYALWRFLAPKGKRLLFRRWGKSIHSRWGKWHKRRYVPFLAGSRYSQVVHKKC